MREKIRLVSSAGTGHFYTTDKNKSAMPDKMEIKKFDPDVVFHFGEFSRIYQSFKHFDKCFDF